MKKNSLKSLNVNQTTKILKKKINNTYELKIKCCNLKKKEEN